MKIITTQIFASFWIHFLRENLLQDDLEDLMSHHMEDLGELRTRLMEGLDELKSYLLADLGEAKTDLSEDLEDLKTEDVLIKQTLGISQDLVEGMRVDAKMHMKS